MSTIILKNVRLSFPEIWKAKPYMEGAIPKYTANLLLDKDGDKDQIQNLKKAIKQAVADGFKGNTPKDLEICLGNGDDKAHDGYENAMFISTSTRQRPTTIDRDRTPLVEEDGKLYAGCYVNAAISFWTMDNRGGRRVNANLLALQFVKDGEKFGGGGVKVNEVFDDISSEQAADAADDDFLS